MRPRNPQSRWDRLRLEDGFTLVEGLVAALLLTIGGIAVLSTFDASARNTFRAEGGQVAVSRAQQELEEIRGLDYSDVALTTTPGSSTDAQDPRSRVSGSSFDLDAGAGSSPAEMAVKNVGGLEQGAVSPGPTPFTSGDIKGKLYRYVVWQNDPKCLAVCPGSRDFKRVVVIVKLDDNAISAGRRYVELQTDISDPDATTLSTTDPGAGGAVLTAQQFFLSDTNCHQPGRQTITADHVQHQTLGTCDSENPQKPDTLFLGAPPDPEPEDPNEPALFDYATDVEPAGGGANDKGLQLLRQDANGCTYSGGTSPQYKIHRWVSEPLASEFSLNGQATLELHTRTINDVVAQGSVCVFVFIRSETVSGGVTTATDTRLIDLSNPPNAFFVYTKNPWPSGAWTRERFVMNFDETMADAGERIGLGLAVRRDSTSGDYLQFMYDHPDFPARLEIKTDTPLE